MTDFARRAASLLAAALVATLGIPALAQQGAPMRVRGTITRIDGDKLAVKTVEGQSLVIALAPDATVVSVVPEKLAAIKPGRFVGTAARPSGDHWTALEVHVFPVGSRLGEGHRPWAPEPGATMTNADVTAVVVHAGRTALTLSTGGQNYVIDVPKGTPVVAMNPGTRSLVKKGAYVYFNQVEAAPDGSLSAKQIGVSKDKRYPVK